MRILHTMLRVGNLDRSIEFYTKVLGMRVLRSTEYPTGRFTNTFVGYQDERDGPRSSLPTTGIPPLTILAQATVISLCKLKMHTRRAIVSNS